MLHPIRPASRPKSSPIARSQRALLGLTPWLLALGAATAQTAKPALQRAFPAAAAVPEDSLDRAALARTELPLDSRLYQLALEVALGRTDVEASARKWGVPRAPDGRIKLEVVGPQDPQGGVGTGSVSQALVESLGGRVVASYRERASVWMPCESLLALAESVAPGTFVWASMPPEELGAALDDSGPNLMGTPSYVAGGDDGSGISIAIIDTGFDGLAAAAAAGLAPSIPAAQQIDLSGGGIEEDGVTHGLLTTQTAFLHAPGADFWIYRVTNSTEYLLACELAVIADVDIASVSLGYTNLGWADNSGVACAGTLLLTNSDTLVFVSAGNYALTHWQGMFQDGGAGFHVWSGTDQLQSVFMDEDATLSVRLSWDASQGTNFDLFIYDNPGLNILASSLNAGAFFESVSYDNPVNGVALRHIVVQRVSGPAVELEIFTGQSVAGDIDLEHIVSSSSLSSPANTVADRCVVVGAVDADDYDSASGAGGISTYYSSRGPTNGGVAAPTLVAPTATSFDPSNSVFFGTSASAPNAAGAAATLWSSAGFLNASSIAYLLRRQAGLFKDWGSSGSDNVYGAGGLWLYPWHRDTVWVDRAFPNVFGLAAYPQYSVGPAATLAQSGGRLLFLGGSYPDSVTVSKQLLFETAVPSAVLGQ